CGFALHAHEAKPKAPFRVLLTFYARVSVKKAENSICKILILSIIRGTVKNMIRQSQAEVHTAASGSTVITEQLICEFVGSMQLRGCRPDSVKKYRHDLSSLYDFLP